MMCKFPVSISFWYLFLDGNIGYIETMKLWRVILFNIWAQSHLQFPNELLYAFVWSNANILSKVWTPAQIFKLWKTILYSLTLCYPVTIWYSISASRTTALNNLKQIKLAQSKTTNILSWIMLTFVVLWLCILYKCSYIVF